MNRTERPQHGGAGLNRRDIIKIGAGLGAIVAGLGAGRALYVQVESEKV